MSKTPFESTYVRASAGALCLLLIAAGTGFVPVAGLSPEVEAEPLVTPPLVSPIEPVVVEPVEPICIEPVGCEEPIGCKLAPVPTPTTVATSAAKTVDLTATLSHGKLLRGSDGRAYLHCSVKVGEAPADAKRQPVSLALVLDTSGSMVASMGLLKRATLGIVERLHPEDRLTIITYSTDARVIYQGSPAGAEQAELESAVAGLLASGGTNISAGIEAGLKAISAQPGRSCLPLNDGFARRMLLMTDGMANQGITDAGGLSTLVTRARGQGVALSAMGLGTSYNEQLLGTLADAGGGAYHYVNRPQGLSAVYAAEVEALRALAAKGAKLTIKPAPGVVVEEIVSWSSSTSADGTHVNIGDLAHGRTLKVVARVRLLNEDLESRARIAAGNDLRSMASVSLSFQDVQSGEAASCNAEGLSVVLTTDAAQAKASQVESIKADLQKIQVAQELAQARADAMAGRREEAKRRVMKLKELTGKKSFSYEAPSGVAQEVEFDELADDMAEGASSERGRAAMKAGDSAARAASRR